MAIYYVEAILKERYIINENTSVFINFKETS